ncbi:MAG TPA: DNA methyltransferase [Chitinophagaceae bacterium]|nr:DNA methyltransferase [Chitinophagaceae bacterium]
MNSHEIEQNVKRIIENFSKEHFLYDLLLAYGISKTSITRLKSGDFNSSKIEGEILYKKKIFFKQQPTDKLLSAIESLAKEERIVKHSPRFAVVTDYKNLVAKDLKLGRNLDISIKDLPKHYGFFLPLANSEFNNYNNNDTEADRNAAYKMATLYDELVTKNIDIYNSRESIHNLNIFLSRLLFCFFAEDTEIFDVEGIFTDTLAQHTNENGGDTHLFLDRLFKRLNTENVEDFPDHLAKNFKYVNGGLFGGAKSNSPIFSQKARKLLLELGGLNWKKINPDIFGSMIQAVVIPEYRSDLGMHYTSVPNIQKLIKPLFLDALYEEFEASAGSASEITKLRKLINRIAKIKFFDPACGSGNFLIITYKEIRLLEIKILQRIIDLSPTPAMEFTSIQLSQFYGIELDDFAHEMAILSLWLAEHQMNKVFEEMLFDYGKSKPILPLKQAGKIVQGNAARVDWKTVCPIGENDEVYIIGNPPYLGYSRQDEEQKKDMAIVFNGIKEYKSLDYISCWFFKASLFIKNYSAKYAFVTTNSITQGEQVALFWPLIFKLDQEITFAYKSFKWTNNAKGNAGVSVVIIGVCNINNHEKFLFDSDIKKSVKNISPNLTDSENHFVVGRNKPISKVSQIGYGSSALDGGHLILSKQEKEKLCREYPLVEKFLFRLMGSQELIKDIERWGIWVSEEEFEKANEIEPLRKKFEEVKKFRLKSKRKPTIEAAKKPFRFGEPRFIKGDVLLIPKVSSERREYLPIGYFKDIIVMDKAFPIYNAEPYLFGIISSKMHMVWLKNVGGRMKTDFSYSSSICYNTFPFPDITLKQKENLNLYVFAILDERAKHPEKTMAQLYDPDKMPKGLKQAHEELDRAVEQCYRIQPFTSDTERLEYLFKLYEEMTKSGTLFEKQKKPKKTTEKTKK